MGLITLFKRLVKDSPLTTSEVDNNWEKIEGLFPTATNEDIGKTIVLNSEKTGFEYAEPISNGVSKINNLKEDVNITAGTNINIETDDINNQIIISADYKETGKYIREKIKKVADFITKTNDENGVAEALENIVL